MARSRPCEDDPVYAEHWAGPSAGRGDDRGGPDRHPPRRRRRGRRRLASRPRPHRRAPVRDRGCGRGAHGAASPYGTAVFHGPACRWVREVNLVRVETAAGDLGRPSSTARGRAALPGRARASRCCTSRSARRSRPRSPPRGWRVGRHLLMALRRAPPESRIPSRRSRPRTVWPLRDEWMRSTSRGARDAVATAMLAWERARAERRPARGRSACATDRAPGRDVPPARRPRTPTRSSASTRRRRTAGAGCAYAVVARAAQRGGRPADVPLHRRATARAQQLYGRLGFRRAWVVHRFSARRVSLTPAAGVVDARRAGSARTPRRRRPGRPRRTARPAPRRPRGRRPSRCRRRTAPRAPRR